MCPGSHALVALKGRIYYRQARYAETEKLLRPYTDIKVFYDGMHAWKTVYMHNLFDWAMSINKTDPAKALSMLHEVERMAKPMWDKWLYYGVQKAENRKKFWAYLRKVRMAIFILKSRTQASDDSWKN